MTSFGRIASTVSCDCRGQRARPTVSTRGCCRAITARHTVANSPLTQTCFARLCPCKTKEHRAETFVFVLLDEDTKSFKGSVLDVHGCCTVTIICHVGPLIGCREVARFEICVGKQKLCKTCFSAFTNMTRSSTFLSK